MVDFAISAYARTGLMLGFLVSLLWMPGSALAQTVPLCQPSVTSNEMACYVTKVPIRREAMAESLALSGTSFVGEFVLGQCCEDKGQDPEALFHYRRARSMLESLHGYLGEPRNETEPHWHTLIIYSLAELCGSMGDLESERCFLAGLTNNVGRRHCAVTFKDPDLASRRLIWNRLKAGDRDVAYQLAQQEFNEHKSDVGAMHDMALAMVEKEPDGVRAYRLYREILERRDRPTVADFDWMGQMAMIQVHIGEAEQYLKKGAEQTVYPDNAYDGWRWIARLQIAQGRFDEARKSIAGSWSTVSAKQIHIRRDMRLNTLGVVAELALAEGGAHLAAEVTQILCREEKRGGRSMQTASQRKAGVCALRLAALRQLSATATLWRRSGNWVEQELVRRELVALIFRSVVSKMPFHDLLDAVDVPVWLYGDVFDAIGYTASKELLSRFALHGERKMRYEASLRAEILRVGKKWTEAREMASAALERLPVEEKLLRARMNLILSMCADEEGQSDLRASYLKAACDLAPSSPLWLMFSGMGPNPKVRAYTVEETRQLKGDGR